MLSTSNRTIAYLCDNCVTAYIIQSIRIELHIVVKKQNFVTKATELKRLRNAK